jgi:hypothetical protein
MDVIVRLAATLRPRAADQSTVDVRVSGGATLADVAGRRRGSDHPVGSGWLTDQ